MTLLLGLCLLLAGCRGNERQEAPPAPPPDAPLLTLSCVTATDAAVPGQTFLVGWLFQPAPGWHLYGNGRNDSGFPPTVALSLPDGWQAGPLRWPAPERHLAAGDILDHVYHGQLMLLQEIGVPDGAVVGSRVTVPARVDWLICRDECVPGRQELEVKVSVAAETHPAPGAGILAAAWGNLPRPAPPGAVELSWTEAAVTVGVPGATRLEFFPDRDCLRLTDLIADGARDGDRLVLRRVGGQEGAGTLKGLLHQKLADGSVRNWIIDFHPGG